MFCGDEDWGRFLTNKHVFSLGRPAASLCGQIGDYPLALLAGSPALDRFGSISRILQPYSHATELAKR